MKFTKQALQLFYITLLAFISFSTAIAQDNSEQQVDRNTSSYGKVYQAPAEEDDQISEMLDSLVKIKFLSKYTDSRQLTLGNRKNYLDPAPEFTYEQVKQRLKKIESPINYEFNPQVKRYIDLYTKRREHTAVMLGLSKLYFPLFEKILEKYDIPIELKYLAVVESALNPMAVSRAGATGTWQFMYGTALLYGLEINSYIDERRDVYKATEAACKYFRDMYSLYGDWLLVIASYNCGPRNVNRAITKSGGKNTFWEISKFLPKETRGYVPAFIAVTYIMNYAKEHGIHQIPTWLSFYELDTISITRPVSIQRLAQGTGVTKDFLNYLNPIYKKDYIPASDSKPYQIILPSNKISSFLANANTIFNQNEYSAQLASNDTYSGNENAENEGIEVVRQVQSIKARRGDDIYSIASRYDCNVKELKQLNKNLKSDKLRTGQMLKVFITKVKKAEVFADATRVSKKNAINEKFIYHTVQRGDTLWNIASRYEGVTVEQIKEYNKIISSRDLVPGKKIKIAVVNI